jgi:hypothetical protein
LIYDSDITGPAPPRRHTIVLCFLGLALATALVLAPLLVGCGETPEPLKTSMKGWELYGRPENGEWRFSLLAGTNRTKTSDEVRATATRLEGVDALRSALEDIAPGQWVTWWSPSWVDGAVALPPSEIVEEVRRISAAQGLELQMPPGGQ